MKQKYFNKKLQEYFASYLNIAIKRLISNIVATII